MSNLTIEISKFFFHKQKSENDLEIVSNSLFFELLERQLQNSLHMPQSIVFLEGFHINFCKSKTVFICIRTNKKYVFEDPKRKFNKPNPNFEFPRISKISPGKKYPEQSKKCFFFF